MEILKNKKRARLFYHYFSYIYDRVNPLFYSKGMRDLVISQARLSNDKKVLEVGAGTGFTTEGILEKIPRRNLTSLDQCKNMIRQARKKFDLSFILGDSEKLPFKDNLFDAAVSAGSIEYWPDPLRAITEMARVARPGGRVVIAGPLKPRTGFFGFICKMVMLFPPEHEYCQWYEKAGLKDIEFILCGPNRLWREYAIVIGGTVDGEKNCLS